jgi:hypothetical protein
MYISAIADFLYAESQAHGDTRRVPIAALWHVLIDGLNPIWPASRTALNGVPLGDVWPCPALARTGPGHDLVPFHKLTGWIAYSLIEPMERILRWKFVGVEDMVGLPEYRNGFRSASISLDSSSLISFFFTPGGLLVDFGVLTLKPGALPVHPESGIPRVPPSHPAIVEWRAMTVIELYAIHLFLSPLIETFFLSFYQ